MDENPTPESTSDHLWIDWTEYHALIELLALKIYHSGWKFDHVLCLARGGMRVGDTLSRVFEKPLAILSTSSYRAVGGTVQGTLDIGQNITMTGKTMAGRVLLVDDLVDSGITLEAVCNELPVRYPDVTELRTAVLWQKPSSIFTPDYVVEVLIENPWIHQPFERYDGVGIEFLLGKSDPG